MPKDINTILLEILNLPRETRAFMAEKILESLDYEGDFEISEEWLQEISRRKRQIEDGTAVIAPMEEIFEKALKTIE